MRSLAHRITSVAMFTLCPLNAALAGEADTTPAPAWALTNRCQDTSEHVCAVGTATGMKSIEEARAAAWSAALTNIARRNLPFLQSVRESGSESLRETTWTRTSTLEATNIDWSGIQEDTGRLSPFIKSGPDGKWNSSVLLLWPRVNLIAEAKRLKESMTMDRAARVIATLPIGDSSAGVGQITITTNPPGAAVIIAGFAAGTTNAILNGVGAGDHEIIVKLPGYVTIEDSVTIRPGQKIERSYQMRKLSREVSLNSEPSDATVFINNRVADIRSGNSVRLDFGTAIIRMEKPGFFPETKVINVDEQMSTLQLALKPMPGYISVLSDVRDANIEIDGKPAGNTDALNIRLSGGTHIVRVSKPGYSDFSETVYVTGVKGRSIVARMKFEAAGTDTPKALTPEQKKWLLMGSGVILAGAAFLTSQSKQEKANRAACEKFTDEPGKTRCLSNADAIDSRARKTNEKNNAIAIGLGAASVITFGFAIGF